MGGRVVERERVPTREHLNFPEQDVSYHGELGTFVSVARGTTLTYTKGRFLTVHCKAFSIL